MLVLVLGLGACGGVEGSLVQNEENKLQVGIAEIDVPWGEARLLRPLSIGSVYASALHVIDAARAIASQRRAVRAHPSRTSTIKRSRMFDVFERSDRPEIQ